MADPVYSTANLILKSLGVMARYADDAPPSGQGWYIAETNLEEIEENAVASRLGTIILNKWEGVAYPLGLTDAAVHSLSQLTGLSDSWMYAGTGDILYRLEGTAPGVYSAIATGLGTEPWTAVSYNPSVSSFPYLYIASSALMLKDNGYLPSPQNMGIRQPQIPVQAQAQEPDQIILDLFTLSSSYVYQGIAGGSIIPYVNVHTTSGVPTSGVQEVNVDFIQPISLFQLLTVDTAASQETVLVLEVTETGFVADFTKTHASGVAVDSTALDMSVPAATTATVSHTFGGTPIAAWPTTLQQEDYIGLYIFVSDPSQIDSITLKFDCGDGTFTKDYFWRTIGQGPLQSALNPNTDSSTAAADAILSNSLGLYTSGTGGISPLFTGQNIWTPLLMQLSDFSSTGRADFNSPNFSWNQVNGYQVEMVTNGNGVGAIVQLASLVLFGGAGPDSFAGTAYDYLFTFFNINDYTESNPCMVMTNVNPPLDTNWVLPRRQPVLLKLYNNFPADPQTTHLRIYRRGGTLADNYRRIDQVPLTALPGFSQNYTDIFSDLQIQGNDTISFTNDVPVTSSLPVPVNTTLAGPISLINQRSGGTVVSAANISVGQQLSIGNVAADNFETVIVTGINPHTGLFGAWIQNTHAAGEPVTATAAYAVPLDIIAVANDIGYFAGDKNNPSFLYISEKGNIQAVSSASYLAVSVPSDAITAIVSSSGNIFISTVLRWWALAPAAQPGASSTVYPTRVDHGCVGKNAWTLRDGVVYYMGQDGLRTFVAGSGNYISEIIEFVWQNTGPTPIPIADPNYFFNVRASTWNRWVFFSYRALDGKTYRIILDCVNKRFRNDSLDAQSMLLEADTNTLVWGDSNGLVHLDRQLVAYDEGVANISDVVQNPIAIVLQTPYNDGGSPVYQKNYNELVIDANTGGNTVTATLDFNDGEFSEIIGTVNTSQRQRVNLVLNNGDGFEGYKVALQLTGAGTTRISLYQAALRSVILAQTRKSFDSWWLKLGTAESKVIKQVYLDIQASATVTVNFYYDSNTTPGYTFSIAPNNGVRNSLRIRLPAILCRLFRIVMESSGDFQLWPDSRIEYKGVAQGKGWAVELILQ